MSRIPVGTVVSLKSGGPVLTVTYVNVNNDVSLIYFNPVSGLFETIVTKLEAVREATTPPQAPQDAAGMRSQSVAKSSLT